MLKALAVTLLSILAYSTIVPEPAAAALGANQGCTFDINDVLCKVDSSETTTNTPPPKVTDPAPGTQNIDPSAPYCHYKLLVPQPIPEDPIWQGHDSTKGKMYSKSCSVKVNRSGIIDGLVWRFVGYSYGLNDQQDNLPPVNERQLIVDQASKVIPAPRISLGPTPTQIAVKVPVWLWINDPGPLTVTAGQGAISVTAHATITSTVWSMGDSVNNPSQGPITSAPTFTCPGTGTPPPPNPGDTTPPCGYTYQWMSTANRTHGKCSWPITATATWTVTWAATTGASGTFTVQSTTTTNIPVGQWHASLVSGPNASPPASGPEPACTP